MSHMTTTVAPQKPKSYFIIYHDAAVITKSHDIT